MFKRESKIDFLAYCIENSYRNIEICNDFYSYNRINKKIKIIKNKRNFSVYLLEDEKNRSNTQKILLYRTKKSNKLFEYTIKLYKLLII